MPPSRRAADDNEPKARGEREILANIRAGDAPAFETLFRAHAAPLCDFALSYLGIRETAEEIVQDLFCWIWEHRFTIDMPHGIRPWLFTAVRNRSLNAARDLRLELSVRGNPARAPRTHGTVRSASAELDANDLAAALARHVGAMPQRCREAFILIREQQLSYADAALVMGIAPKTVEIHMTRAMAILRAELGDWLRS